MKPEDSNSSSDLARSRTDLAVYRTTMAANRSLMAWVRTGLSLIGFGYTIYRIIHSLGDRVEPNAARNTGLILIAWGTVSMVFGCIEYWQTIRDLQVNYGIDVRKFPPLFAGGFIVLGVVIFLCVVLQVL